MSYDEQNIKLNNNQCLCNMLMLVDSKKNSLILSEYSETIF